MREIRDVEQVPGEPRRRWFFSHEQDLLVWLGEDGAPVAFQLAYGKYRHERALRWKAGKGFAHDAVDDGEQDARKAAAVLVPDGYFDANKVLARFTELAVALPPDIVAFVSAKLKEHPNFGEDSLEDFIA